MFTSIFPYTLLFTSFLLLPINEAFFKDIINQTCKACAEAASSPEDLSYDFCSASLGSVPVSHAANLPGLGLISLELALENATDTLAIITKMLQENPEPDHSLRCTDCLKACWELYTDMTAMLNECVADFVATKYDPVFMWVTLVREGTVICEEGFGEEGSESPLTFENYSLLQLCSIVLCIMEEFLPLSSSVANTLIRLHN